MTFVVSFRRPITFESQCFAILGEVTRVNNLGIVDLLELILARCYHWAIVSLLLWILDLAEVDIAVRVCNSCVHIGLVATSLLFRVGSTSAGNGSLFMRLKINFGLILKQDRSTLVLAFLSKHWVYLLWVKIASFNFLHIWRAEQTRDIVENKRAWVVSSWLASSCKWRCWVISSSVHMSCS